jgi:E3 Ubiquitin ligase
LLPSVTCSLLNVGLWPPLLGLLGVVGGVYLFFQGFRMLQYKRLILNTPFSKIRSASIGLVEVNGMPTGPQTLTAPITGDSCYFYRARAWQWKEGDSSKDSKWALVLDEAMFVPFFLEDSTGKVLVNAQGADLDVHRSFKDDVSASFFRPGSPIPQNVRDFVVRRGIIPTDKIRLEEQIVRPAYPLFVFGTLGENRLRDSWAPQRHVSRSGVSVDFSSQAALGFNVTFSRSKDGAVGELLQDVLDTLPVTMSQQGRTVFSARETLPTPPDRAVPALTRSGGAPLGSALKESGGAQVRMLDTPNVSVRAVTMEMPPDGMAASSSAPKPNPQAPPATGDFDLKTHAAIGKGDRNDPFTISSHSQREVVESLAWKSTAFIWGGPVLTLACGYFLWIYFQWM